MGARPPPRANLCYSEPESRLAPVSKRDLNRIGGIIGAGHNEMAPNVAHGGQTGWQSFNSDEGPYTADQVRRARVVYVALTFDRPSSRARIWQLKWPVPRRAECLRCRDRGIICHPKNPLI